MRRAPSAEHVDELHDRTRVGGALEIHDEVRADRGALDESKSPPRGLRKFTGPCSCRVAPVGMCGGVGVVWCGGSAGGNTEGHAGVASMHA